MLVTSLKLTSTASHPRTSPPPPVPVPAPTPMAARHQNKFRVHARLTFHTLAGSTCPYIAGCGSRGPISNHTARIINEGSYPWAFGDGKRSCLNCRVKRCASHIIDHASRSMPDGAPRPASPPQDLRSLRGVASARREMGMYVIRACQISGEMCVMLVQGSARCGAQYTHYCMRRWSVLGICNLSTKMEILKPQRYLLTPLMKI